LFVIGGGASRDLFLKRRADGATINNKQPLTINH
jgi:hypothetical protein